MGSNRMVIGFRKIFQGSIGLIIASILTSVGGWIATGPSIFSVKLKISVSSTGYPIQASEMITHISSFIAWFMMVAGVLGIIGGFIFLVVSTGYIIPGFKMIAKGKEELSPPTKLIIVGLPIIGAGGIISGIGAIYVSHVINNILSRPQEALGAIGFLGVLTLIGLAGRIIGYIGLGWFNLKLYNSLKDGFLLATAILFLVAIPIPIIGFIAWIFMTVTAYQLIDRFGRSERISGKDNGL
ncbi:MAG: hypothetical protein GXO43_08615 [Crenarchaeota archaeon]|nr:hypothetical protein [Thermoproteota archaeon]